DPGLPVAYFSRSSGVRLARLSEPTINQLVPSDDAALSDGTAGTRASVPSTYTANPTTATSRASSAMPMRRPQLERPRTGAGRGGLRGGAPATPCGRPRRGIGITAVRCRGRGLRGGGGGGGG